MRFKPFILVLLTSIIYPPTYLYAESSVLLQSALTLRSGDVEWQEFERGQTQPSLEIKFSWQAKGEAFLEWTQYDVKQNWDVSVNGAPVGKLVQDENRMSVVVAIPPGILVSGENRVAVKPSGMSLSDDIVLEGMRICSGSAKDFLREGELRIQVRDKETDNLTPSRITLTRMDGSLAPHGLSSEVKIAARIGTIYTLEGEARVPVPAGKYRVFAGRGFEYSLAQTEVEINRGEVLDIPLEISRVVDTSGFAACDTHIHTLTHSGHGDATLEERMVTLAGEGLELAIATDHNKYVDYERIAMDLGARSFFTPVVGCEVTTPRGHFNVFPISKKARPISHQTTDWHELFAEIRQTPDVGVIILNHARDSHSGVRPFAIDHHFAVQGENAVGWELGFNAMEVLNSAATQSEMMQLTHDWMALLNGGKKITPIGCSDSHDVSRHFVGQARTYIRCDDERPDSLKVDECTKALVDGRASVSYGVFVRLIVEERYESGDLVSTPRTRPVHLVVEAQTPHWLQADRVQLYVNGELFEERGLDDRPSEGPGRLWRECFAVPAEEFDAHVVAVVTGPGCEGNYWRCAKPYQASSIQWQSRIYGCSGAVWLDRDHNGIRDTARDYAIALVEKDVNDMRSLVKALEEYDRAVAIQVFSELFRRKMDIGSGEFVELMTSAEEHIKDAYRSVLLEVRNHILSTARR